MTYLEKKEKENYLLYLIEKERLYSLKKVADDYECSVRTIKRMISNLRNQGKTITYCRKSNKYLLKNKKVTEFVPVMVFICQLKFKNL